MYTEFMKLNIHRNPPKTFRIKKPRYSFSPKESFSYLFNGYFDVPSQLIDLRQHLD